MQEVCYNVTVSDGASPESVYNDERLAYCLRETFDPSGYSLESFLEKKDAGSGKVAWVLELGPRLNFTTAWSTNAVSILRASGVSTIPRIEVRAPSRACHSTASLRAEPPRCAASRCRGATDSRPTQRFQRKPRPRSRSRCTTR
jgi:hypothetical protein